MHPNVVKKATFVYYSTISLPSIVVVASWFLYMVLNQFMSRCKEHKIFKTFKIKDFSFVTKISFQTKFSFASKAPNLHLPFLPCSNAYSIDVQMLIQSMLKCLFNQCSNAYSVDAQMFVWSMLKCLFGRCSKAYFVDAQMLTWSMLECLFSWCSNVYSADFTYVVVSGICGGEVQTWDLGRLDLFRVMNQQKACALGVLDHPFWRNFLMALRPRSKTRVEPFSTISMAVSPWLWRNAN